MIPYGELSPIESLGYAKSNLFEAMDTTLDIPREYRDKLYQAYELMDEVEEYLYQN